MTVKAKFIVTSVSPDEYGNTSVSLLAAIDGEENKEWAKATPSGHISISIDSEREAAKAFTVGATKYVTFEDAE